MGGGTLAKRSEYRTHLKSCGRQSQQNTSHCSKISQKKKKRNKKSGFQELALVVALWPDWHFWEKINFLLCSHAWLSRDWHRPTDLEVSQTKLKLHQSRSQGGNQLFYNQSLSVNFSAHFMCNHCLFRYAGIVNGITNTMAVVPGTFTPSVASAIVQNVSKISFSKGKIKNVHFQRPQIVSFPMFTWAHFGHFKQGTQEEWRKAFLVAAGFSFAGGLVFLLFAQGDVQSWAQEPVEPSDKSVKQSLLVLEDTDDNDNKKSNYGSV